MRPNKLGWLSSLSYSVDNPFIDVSTFGGGPAYIATPATYKAELSLIITDPGAVHELLQDWMHNGINGPIYQKEYMCLYCGSPNSIEHTHCSKCGAPRSFVIG
jgi:hypothetical protein